jgi:valyl-tRNA synthetase
MESQGRDIKLDEKRVEGYRNFATKLWNASRFAQSNGIGGSSTIEPPKATLAVNKWILAEAVKTIQAIDLALADLRYDEAANAIYHFVWDQFCDWYLELIKAPLGEAIGDETKAVAGWVLDQILLLLHPFMPFVTEDLWHALAKRDHDIIVAHWPMADARSIDPEAVAEVEWLIRLVGEIRSARTELNVPPGARLQVFVGDASDTTAARLDRNQAILSRLARLDSIQRAPFAGGGAAQVVVDEATYALPLEGVIDLAAERARLAKGAEAAEKEASSLGGRLNNPAFVEKAKPEAVAKAREDHAAKTAEAERLRAALARLG